MAEQLYSIIANDTKASLSCEDVYSTARGLDSFAAATISCSALQYTGRHVNKADRKRNENKEQALPVSLPFKQYPFIFCLVLMKEQEREVFMTCTVDKMANYIIQCTYTQYHLSRVRLGNFYYTNIP